MLNSKGQYMIYHLSQGNIRPKAGTECHAVEATIPYSSHGIKEPTPSNKGKLTKENRDNIDMWNVMERAMWAPNEDEDFEFRVCHVEIT